MRRLVVAAWSGAVLVLAACSGGDSGDAAAAVVSAVAAVATTSSVPVEVAATTALPTTSELVTTTTVSTEDLIRQAVQDYLTGYSRCTGDPARCEVLDFLSSEGPAHDIMAEGIREMVETDLYVDSDLHGSYIVTDAIEYVDGHTAVAINCWFDAATVLGPPGPDGLPTIVNDSIKSDRFRHTLYLIDGVWRVGMTEQLEEIGEGDQCGGR